jgi:thioredoxin 1
LNRIRRPSCEIQHRHAASDVDRSGQDFVTLRPEVAQYCQRRRFCPVDLHHEVPIMSLVKPVTYKCFVTEVLESSIPVLVDFYADWCGPCRMLAPALEVIASEFAGKVKVVKVNVDEEPEIAGHFEIQSIPTLVTFDNGRLLDRLTGIGAPGQLRQMLTRLAGNAGRSTSRVG